MNKTVLFIIFTTLFFSCKNDATETNYANNKGEELVEKLKVEENLFHEKIIKFNLLNRASTVLLGKPFRFQFLDGIALITVQEYLNNCNVDNVQNPNNNLKENEKYVAFKINYEFNVYKVQKYGNESSIEQTWSYSQSDWIVVDEKGTYYKPLEVFTPTIRPIKEEDLKNEGKQPVFTPAFGGTLTDGEKVSGWITFKVRNNLNLTMIIYGAKHFESLVENPVTFATSLTF